MCVSRGIRSIGVLVALSMHVTMTSAIVTLEADLTEFVINNVSMPMFRCTAHSVIQNTSYYFDHLITWSKIGIDGREKYISINWDLTVHGKKGNYMVSSEYMVSRVTSSRQLVFLLSKPELTPDDHGEYICRLHDFDKNLLAEASVLTNVFDKRLALSPYNTEADSKTDVAVNCMFNTSGLTSPKTYDVILSHLNKKGQSKRIATNGKLIRKSMSSRYSVTTVTGKDKIKHNVLTVKSISKKDAGKIRCDLKKGQKVLASTNATLSVDTPKLLPTPTFYLQMPVDSIAHFKCECVPDDIKACRRNSMAWTFTSKHTGNSTVIYKDGKVLADPTLYEVIKGKNGSLNLTINGVRDIESEGQFICWLHKNGSSVEIAHASIPVSVNPVAMGLFSLLGDYPSSIKILCTVTGTRWNQHYLETHSIAWHSVVNGTRTDIAVNSDLKPGIDATRFTVVYYCSRYYSILFITNVTEADHGEYSCQLIKNLDNTVIKEETLPMYGKGNTTVFAGSYATERN